MVRSLTVEVSVLFIFVEKYIKNNCISNDYKLMDSN